MKTPRPPGSAGAGHYDPDYRYDREVRARMHHCRYRDGRLTPATCLPVPKNGNLNPLFFPRCSLVRFRKQVFYAERVIDPAEFVG
jgi:hypothetical protein